MFLVMKIMVLLPSSPSKFPTMDPSAGSFLFSICVTYLQLLDSLKSIFYSSMLSMALQSEILDHHKVFSISSSQDILSCNQDHAFWNSKNASKIWDVGHILRHECPRSKLFHLLVNVNTAA